MQTVRDIATQIVAREGGYVNDPDDPGGATKFGVTIHTMRRLGLDLDRDGDVDAQDVKGLTRDRAIDIFVTHYFERPLIAQLPDALQPTVFDMYVNAGANAIKILQRLLSQMGLRLSWMARWGRILSLRRGLRGAQPRTTSWTPMVLRGAIITFVLLIADRPAANTRAPVRAVRGAGSSGPKNSLRRDIA